MCIAALADIHFFVNNDCLERDIMFIYHHPLLVLHQLLGRLAAGWLWLLAWLWPVACHGGHMKGGEAPCGTNHLIKLLICN